MNLPYVKIILNSIVLAGISFSAFCQPVTDVPAGKYKAGYREYKALDTLRRYKPGAARTHPLFFRPVEIDVWYPAEITAGPPLNFHYFMELFEKRANSFQDSMNYTGIADEMIANFTAPEKTGNKNVPGPKTKSYLNAASAKGKFPLIIYLSAYNGMSYENVPLFENLAGSGYIVVSVSSIGRYPGNMTTNKQDLFEQVGDAGFAARLVGTRQADTSRIGVMGWSFGGLAGTLFAMQHKSVRALLSLDGSEVHAYGADKAEDKDFNDLRQSAQFDLTALSGIYTYLASDDTEDQTADSIYCLPDFPGRNARYLHLLNTQHEDFSCLNNAGQYAGTPYQLINDLALAYFDQHLKGKETVYDQVLAAALKEKKVSVSPKKVLQPAVTPKRIPLKGRVLASETSEPIPYASVGIPSGHSGTVADSAGNFSFFIDHSSPEALIRISSLGYEARTFKAGELILLLERGPILLTAQENKLADVIVSAKKPRLKTIGNTGKSTFLSIGFPMKDRGSEIGTRMSLGKKNVLLKSFSFNISYNRVDTGTLRLNIYSFIKGKPALNLLNTTIVTGIGKKPGNYSIALAPYHLLLKGDILISLESISERSTKDGMIYFSSGFLSSSYHRYVTEGDWVKSRGLGVAFNLQVQETD